MNVNVTYSGYTLADAASCVMMRLPVPGLVWDMEVLWKVWNEPLPAIDAPEPVLTDAQEEAEPVNQEAAKAVIAELEEHIRRQMPSRAKPVTYNGVTYPSLTACAKAFGLTVSACSRRLQKGQPLDKKLKAGGRPLVPVTVNGAEYPSMAAAAKALGVPYQTLKERIQRGLPADMRKWSDRGTPVAYQGKEYPSIEALARATGISSQSWLYRIRHNIPLDAPWGKGGRKQKTVAEPVPEAPAAPAPEPAVKSVVINGRDQSLHDADEAERRLKSEHKPSPLGTLTMGGAPKSRPVTYNGKEYPNMEALAREYNRHVSYCYDHIRKGLPIVKKEERQEPDDVDERSLREIRATPADEMKAWQKKWKACRFGGKKYTSLNALADIAEVSLGQAYKGVQNSGIWLREDEI